MDILFWSGGKDAYLALQFYKKKHPDKTLKLLTTYKEETEVVPHQNIALSHIQKQATQLNLTLIEAALPADCSNATYLKKVEQALANQDNDIEYLVFGDWYLQDMRQWREKMFEQMGYRCLFPIWKKSIHDLLPVLQFKPVDIKVSAVQKKFQSLIKVGEAFDQSFVVQLQHLSEKIDPMGEKGEFHTKVSFQNSDDTI